MGQKLSKCILFSFQNTESMVASFYQPVTKTQIQIYPLLFVLICDLKRKEVKLLLFFSNHTPQQPVNTSFINSHLVFCHQLMKWSEQENGHFFKKSQQSPYAPSGLVCGSAGSQQKVAWPVVYRTVSSPLADISFRLPTFFHKLVTKNQIRIDTAGVYWLFWCVIWEQKKQFGLFSFQIANQNNQ